MMKVSDVLDVSVEDLRIGMYVSGLDKPWLETPFLLQGFYIETVEDIEELKKHCVYVQVDIHKGTDPRKYPRRTIIDNGKITKTVGVHYGGANAKKKDSQLSDILGIKRTPEKQRKLESLFPNRKLKVYEDQLSATQELGNARLIYKDLNHCMTSLVLDVQKRGTFDVGMVKSAVDPMIESVIRNPDACMWLARLKNSDTYTYKHSMGSSVWAVALGRQIGLPKVDLKNLAVGTLLCDIGKLKLPIDLLNKPGRLSKGEFTMMNSHVELGIEALQQTPGITRPIFEIVQYHHERFNGKGYPKKLIGNQIPILARIAAICDCYDAMTSERPYASAISPSLAVRKLYEWRDEDFQLELVEEFIQAIGLYPAGTLVELSSGAVGIVLAESRTRRLRPQVLMLLDEKKQPLDDLVAVDLKETTVDPLTQEPLDIISSLSPGSYDIDPEAIYY